MTSGCVSPFARPCESAFAIAPGPKGDLSSVLDQAGGATHVDVCVTALASRPIRVGKLEPLYSNRVFDETVIEAISEACRVRCKPLKNIATEPTYRREMVGVYVKRALPAALSRPRSA